MPDVLVSALRSVRRQGYSSEEAQDLTQGFFARLLEKRYLRDYQRERGRFRTFLLASLQQFLANERDWAHAQKRGGGVSPLPLDAIIQDGENRYSLEPRSSFTPEKIYVQAFPGPDGKWQVSANGGTNPQRGRDGRERFFVSAEKKLVAVAVATHGSTFELSAPRANEVMPLTILLPCPR